MRARHLGAAAVALPMLALLTGCTVPTTGLLAFTRTDAGVIRAEIRMCEGHVDGVSVYIDDAHSYDVDLPEPVAGDDHNPGHVTGAGGMDLPDLEDWLRPRTTYYSYAGSNDHEHAADGPELTAKKLAKLEPGQYLALAHQDYATHAMTAGQFAAEADAFCATG